MVTISLRRIQHQDLGYDQFLVAVDGGVVISEDVTDVRCVAAFAEGHERAADRTGQGARPDESRDDLDLFGACQPSVPRPGPGPKHKRQRRVPVCPAIEDHDALAKALEDMMDDCDAEDHRAIQDLAKEAAEGELREVQTSESGSGSEHEQDSNGGNDSDSDRSSDDLEEVCLDDIGEEAARAEAAAAAEEDEPEPDEPAEPEPDEHADEPDVVADDDASSPVATRARRRGFFEFRAATSLEACESLRLRFQGDLVGGAYVRDCLQQPARVLGRVWLILNQRTVQAACQTHSGCKMMLSIRSPEQLPQAEADAVSWLAVGAEMAAGDHSALARRIRVEVYRMRVRS